jgi:hypothetical protein
MNNQKATLAIIAIVAAIGLVGAVAVQSIVISQQAYAGDYESHGCKKYSQGYESSNGKCFHKD